MDTERGSTSEHPALDLQVLKHTSALSIKRRLRPVPGRLDESNQNGSPTRSRSSAVTLLNCMAKPSSVRRTLRPLMSMGGVRSGSKQIPGRGLAAAEACARDRCLSAVRDALRFRHSFNHGATHDPETNRSILDGGNAGVSPSRMLSRSRTQWSNVRCART